MIHAAVQRGELAAVQQLLDDDPRAIDAPDHDGRTPLIAAIAHEQPAIARFLVERGARLEPWDHDGRNAFEWAADGSELRAWLVECGATSSLHATIDFPYDRDFPPATVRMLEMLRDSTTGFVAADADVLALLADDMPADLAALIHTWAHKPASASAWIGICELVRPYLGSHPGVDGEQLVIGEGESRSYVARWDDGDDGAQAQLSELTDDGDVTEIGTFEALDVWEPG